MPLSPLRRPGPVLWIIVALVVVLLAGQAGFSGTSGRTVRVQPGDSLWALAGKYGVSIDQLAASNGMKKSDLLLAGRTLKIPGPGPGVGGRAGPSHPSAAPAAAARAAMRTFCTTYRPPTGPRGRLPGLLAAHPERLVLRPVFVKWSNAYRVPPDLVEAISWHESGWQNSVVSSANARGIGQLLPQTADFVNHSLLGTNLRLDIAADNIRMTAAFLGFLLRATGGQVCGAVASYFQGYRTLVHVGVLPVSQTYVRSVLSVRPRFRS